MRHFISQETAHYQELHHLFYHVFIGDEGFPLKDNMLRLYPGRNLDENLSIFNYRLSQARRIIENSFGISVARWRIFRRPIIAKPDHVVLYTKAAIALHNFLRTTESSIYCPKVFIDAEDGAGNVINGTWRDDSSIVGGLQSIGQIGGNRHSMNTASVRNSFKDYFVSSQGELHWQYEYVRRTS